MLRDWILTFKKRYCQWNCTVSPSQFISLSRSKNTTSALSPCLGPNFRILEYPPFLTAIRAISSNTFDNSSSIHKRAPSLLCMQITEHCKDSSFQLLFSLLRSASDRVMHFSERRNDVPKHRFSVSSWSAQIFSNLSFIFLLCKIRAPSAELLRNPKVHLVVARLEASLVLQVYALLHPEISYKVSYHHHIISVL